MSKKTVKPKAQEVPAQEVPAQEVQVEEVQAEKKPNRGIGKFIIEQILTTPKSNKEILDAVIKDFDGAKTSMACIAWYKSKLRREGQIPARTTKVAEVAVAA